MDKYLATIQWNIFTGHHFLRFLKHTLFEVSITLAFLNILNLT